ncbi:MAG: sigma-70 family RNA polymerase sigma factor [Candidatus Riflebacteria bacterium]|nr:sigma-70 family RNA polymerase sigma factor [Candidatus Riflebacteria bacterium]
MEKNITEAISNEELELAKRFSDDSTWEDAFNDIVKLYQGKILAIANSMLGIGREAEDAAQEVFIKAMRSRKTFVGERIRPWLKAIAHNYCTDIIRKKCRNREVLNETPEMIAVASFESQDQSTELPAWLSKVAPAEREILLLRVVEEMSYAEISQITGMAEGSIRNLVSKCLKKLREEIE